MAKRLEIIDGKKHCHRCKRWLDVSLFYDDPRAFTKLRGRCKECDIDRRNLSHSTDLTYALRCLCSVHFRNGKTASERRQRFIAESCVTRELLRQMWDDQDGRCAVTQVPMTHIQGKGYRIWTNVTLDRIDNDRGYTRNNIRLVCRAVNYMKAGMTDREMFQWAALILNGPAAKKP